MVFAEAYLSPVPSPATTMPGKQIYDSEEEEKIGETGQTPIFLFGSEPKLSSVEVWRRMAKA